MRLSTVLGVIIAVLAATSAYAADKPRVGPPEAWVLPALPSEAPKASATAAVALLSSDTQVRFDATGTSSFTEVQAKVQTPEGLGALGTVSLAWSPATDTLVVHRLRILREGKIIDCLPKDGAFNVLRREARLETAATLDGLLTVVVQPVGLQVGDILDLAYTLRREDPLLRGRIDTDLLGFDAAPSGQVRVRALWPKGSSVAWRAENGLQPPVLIERDGQMQALFEAQQILPLAKPQGAPLRFQLGRELVLSNYADWSAVSALMAPLFLQAETLPSGSPVAEEAKAIAASTADPAARAQAALILVQDKVRYFLQAIGDGGLKPASADETWSRRWGDCKAKTALLVALLKALGIRAEPVLVSSTRGAGLDTRLPALSAFDHVLVRARIGDRDYWLDGTRTGDVSLPAIQTPDFGFALPVRAQGAALVKLEPPPAVKPLAQVSILIDATGGVDKSAPFHVDHVIRGDAGLAIKSQLANLPPDDLDRALKAYWRGRYDFVEIAKVSAGFDAEAGEERLTMDGSAKLDWSAGGYEANGANLGWRFDVHRDPGPHADAPFTVAYPGYDLTEETIRLPDRGKGFSVWGEEVDRTLAGYAFKRRTSLKNGVFHIETSTRALVPEVSLAQAKADAETVTELSKSTLKLRDPEQTAKVAAEDKAILEGKPTTRQGLLDQGQALLTAGRFREAEADFDRTVALDPKSGDALVYRTMARVALGRTANAAADLDAAEALNVAPMLVANGRGFVAQLSGRPAEAISAYTRVLEMEPGSRFALEHRAEVEAARKDYRGALADIDRALRDDPGSERLHAARAVVLTALNDKAGASAEAAEVGTSGKVSEQQEAYLKVTTLLRAGDRASARTEADRLVTGHPTAEAWLLHAATRDPKDSAGQEADAKAAYGLDAKSIGALVTLANLRRVAKDYRGAQDWLMRAIPLTPDNAELRTELAEARFRNTHDDAQAALDFADARSKAAGDPIALNNLCFGQATLGINLEDALADCDAALKLRPDDGGLMDSRAFALLRLGRSAEAKTGYDMALTVRPDLADSLYGRSFAERRLGEAAAADRDEKAAQAQDPQVVGRFSEYGLSR